MISVLTNPGLKLCNMGKKCDIHLCIAGHMRAHAVHGRYTPKIESATLHSYKRFPNCEAIDMILILDIRYSR